MTLRISLPSAAIGAAALGLVLLAVSAAAPQSVATALSTLLRVKVISPIEVVGMPAAEDIVNFDSLSILGANQNGSIDLPSNGSVSIYTVPVTHRLVITGWWTGGNLSLFENLGGTLTPKVNLSAFASPGLPLVFNPGSELVLSNLASSSQNAFLNFSGYLEEL